MSIICTYDSLIIYSVIIVALESSYNSVIMRLIVIEPLSILVWFKSFWFEPEEQLAVVVVGGGGGGPAC